MPDEPFESARNMHMRAVFENLSRSGYETANASPDMQKFEERVRRIRSKMSEHIDRHSPTWIAKETLKLFEKHRGKLRPQLSRKRILQTETSPAALAQRASQNVEQRMQQRFQRFENIAERMRTQISLKTPDPDGSPPNRNRMSI